jgi:hypothetical protein
MGRLVARVGEIRIYTKLWSSKLKESDHSKELVVDGKIILEWILGKDGGKLWTVFIWLRVRTNGGLL